MALIKFEGKPIEKFIEVVSQGIGRLYNPTAIRKEARAEAYKIGVIENAKAKANVESQLIGLELSETIQQRLIYQETRKQNNIESVIEIAAEQIEQQDEVSNEKVDNDWTTRFFRIVEDISASDMQKLWGRILSGEVKQPGSFSLRTLEILKNLSREEAEIFTKFSELKIETNNRDFIPYRSISDLEKFNIQFSEILLLTELGLISSGNSLALVSKGNEKEIRVTYSNGETGILVTKSPNQSTHTVRILSFTKTGSELSGLITFEKNQKYIDYVCSHLSSPHTKIKVGQIGIVNEEKCLIDAYDYDQTQISLDL